MGLLDRWSKKNQTERLEKNAEPKAEVKTAQVKDEKKPAVKKSPAKTKKATAKKTDEAMVSSQESTTDDQTQKKTTKKTINSILVRALVTEKSAIKQSENKYSFVVANNANKAVVKKAVEEVYGVKPVSVNMINVQGKSVRFGNRLGKRSDFKKAIVTLPKGKTIVIHEGV